MLHSPPPIPVAPHISEENLRQLAIARQMGRKVRRAASVASFDGWTIAIFAGLTLLIGMTDPSSVLMGLAMGGVAYVELRGAARLRRLESDAARTLGFNQIALAAILIMYALWRLHVEMTGPGHFGADLGTDPEVAQMLKPFEGMYRQILKMVYLGIIAIAVGAQGSMSLYYFTRRSHIDAYLTQTPGWIVDMQRAGVAI